MLAAGAVKSFRQRMLHPFAKCIVRAAPKSIKHLQGANCVASAVGEVLNGVIFFFAWQAQGLVILVELGDDEICATKRSYQSLSQSHKGVSEAYLPKVCYRCLRRVFHRVSQKCVCKRCPQECLRRVSSKSVTGVSQFDVL